MSKYNIEMLVVLSDQITDCLNLKQVDHKYALNLFNLLTPGMIAALDSEVSANPQLLSEAMSLLETAAQLSAFYSSEGAGDLVSTLRHQAISMRTGWKRRPGYVDNNGSLQKELMEEYFVNSEEDLSLFLEHNPFYMGVYLYVYVRIMAMA